MVKCDTPQHNAKAAEHHKTEDTSQCRNKVHDVPKPDCVFQMGAMTCWCLQYSCFNRCNEKC